MFFAEYISPIGKLTITSDGDFITGLFIENQKRFLAPFKNDALIMRDLPVFNKAFLWLYSYFCGEKVSPCSLPLKLFGTDFQKLIWGCLCKIPYGGTLTYGELAKIAANERGAPVLSARAVGAAVSENPVSIIVPCHRVIGKNGSLTGYSAGLNKKSYLLNLERKCKDL